MSTARSMKSLAASAVAAGLVGFTLLPLPALAVDEVNVTRGGTLAGPGVAVHGYDVVAFFAGEPTVGDDEFAVAHQGATYRFSSQANLDAFKAEPAKYVPAYGGYCAYGVALGKKLDGDPRFWRVVDGKLYLNLNGDVQATWAKELPGNIAKADARWSTVRSTAVEKL